MRAVPDPSDDGSRERAAEALRRATGSLSTAAMSRMLTDMPWFAELTAESRSWVGQILQAGIQGFVDWFRRGDDDAFPGDTAAAVFGAAPRTLTGVITLGQTVDLVRLGIEVVESHVDEVVDPDDAPAVHAAVLRYAREVAFATAEVYARAAEARGAWDARLEALVVDSVLRAEADEAVASRASALGWAHREGVTVVLGPAPAPRTEDLFDQVRRAARVAGMDALCATQGDRLVVILGGGDRPRQGRPHRRPLLRRRPGRGRAPRRRPRRRPTSPPGPPCPGCAPRSAGPTRRGRSPATTSCPSGCSPATGTPAATWSRRCSCRCAGQPARDTLIDTLTAYFQHGQSLEATARALFVHPNTVRYRLRQAAELTGLSATDPREALTLQLALVLGRQAHRPAGDPIDGLVVGTLQSSAGEFRARRTRMPDRPTRKAGAVLVIVAPGQGAQTPGFLTPWLEDPTFASRFEWLSTVAGLDLAHYGTEADAETIRDTQIAQPLLVATGLIAALELFPHPADAFSQIGAVAGHSVGELAAAAGARAITAEQAMVLVRERGKAMAEAAAATATGMTAVLGGDRDEVLAAIEAQGLDRRPTTTAPARSWPPARWSSCRRFADNPPAKARLIPLSVAGAFHTEHMAPAVGHLATLARSVSTHDPRTPWISNRDGQVVHDGREVMAPHRRPDRPARCAGTSAWRPCPTSASPACSRCRRPAPSPASPSAPCPGVETFALKTPDQLDDARAFCAKHGEASVIDTTPTWLMVVSPSKGTFHRSEEAGEADVLEPGAAARRRRQPA